MSDFQEFAFSDKFRIFEEEKKKIEILRNYIFLKCLPFHIIEKLKFLKISHVQKNVVRIF